jgi:hypothetical protein
MTKREAIVYRNFCKAWKKYKKEGFDVFIKNNKKEKKC